jgi:AcrR family transcriptional regulator
VSTQSSGEVEPALTASAKRGAAGDRETGAQPGRGRPDPDRERLLRATREVLERSGWWGFKVDSVLKQARLSTRCFYRHFSNKSDLLLGLIEWELAALMKHLIKATRNHETAPAQVRAYATAMIDLAYREDFSKPLGLYGMNWRYLMREYPDAADFITEKMLAPLQAAIQRGVECGDFRSSDPHADATAIFHLVGSVVGDEAALGPIRPREEIEDLVLPFIGRALGCDHLQQASKRGRIPR